MVAILDARMLTKLLPRRIAPISSSTFSNNLCVLFAPRCFVASDRSLYRFIAIIEVSLPEKKAEMKIRMTSKTESQKIESSSKIYILKFIRERQRDQDKQP